MKFTCNDGAEYELLPTSALKHINPQPYTYDAQYCATYDKPEYVRQSEILQALRYGFATAAHGKLIRSLTDVGYGNGAFMKFARQHTDDVFGLDVTDVPVPQGCVRIEDYQPCDVITFHDCLEHFHDIDFVAHLPCNTLVVSLPYCHLHTYGQQWFETWHHRKPGEHIYHFNSAALHNTMHAMGWNMVSSSTHEDIVRKSRGDYANILSMAFKRHK
jgi:hypothetical protein